MRFTCGLEALGAPRPSQRRAKQSSWSGRNGPHTASGLDPKTYGIKAALIFLLWGLVYSMRRQPRIMAFFETATDLCLPNPRAMPT